MTWLETDTQVKFDNTGNDEASHGFTEIFWPRLRSQCFGIICFLIWELKQEMMIVMETGYTFPPVQLFSNN